MYFSHDSIIKYIDSIIKCICFELFYYAINLNDVSSFVVFSNFDYIFDISIDVLLVIINEIIYLFKRKNLSHVFKK